MAILYTINQCCDKLSKEIEKDCMFSILDNIPFTTVPTEPTVWILNDGGHGGAEDTKYCPFCGTKIIVLNKT